MMHGSIEETMGGGIAVTTAEEPPLLPELQHLNMPPPPPPPPMGGAHDPEVSSLSSNSNVGMIQMVLDNEPEEEVNVIEVPPVSAHSVLSDRTRSPPVASVNPNSPPPVHGRSASNHRRGRSGEGNAGFKGGIKGITERLRSNSRGRNATKSPETQTSNTPSPYESVPPLYF